MKEHLTAFTLEDGPLFRPSFYTTAMAYDRRERDPFPPVNIYHWGQFVLVQALIPGLRAEDVGVRMEGCQLIIEGAMPRREGRYFHAERYSGPFCRKLSLGVEVEPHPSIGLKDGIMHIILKRRKEA